jgi:hypothetical protein
MTNYELIREGFGLDFALEITTFFGGTVEGYRIPCDQGRLRGLTAGYMIVDELLFCR